MSATLSSAIRKAIEIDDIKMCRQGNMSEVVVGHHPKHKVVIVKMLAERLSKTPMFIDRWWQEVWITQKLAKLTAVPEIYQIGISPRPWFLQRHIGFITLRDWANLQSYPLSEDVRKKSFSIIIAILKIISIATQNNITHRDITMENIILDNDEQPYLIDWGLASTTLTIKSNCRD